MKRISPLAFATGSALAYILMSCTSDNIDDVLTATVFWVCGGFYGHLFIGNKNENNKNNTTSRDL